MKKNHQGRIIYFSDWTAASGRPRYKDFLPYYVSKGSLVSLSEVLALELAPEILVNVIAPGPILPPKTMSKKIAKSLDEGMTLTCGVSKVKGGFEVGDGEKSLELNYGLDIFIEGKIK